MKLVTNHCAIWYAGPPVQQWRWRKSPQCNAMQKTSEYDTGNLCWVLPRSWSRHTKTTSVEIFTCSEPVSLTSAQRQDASGDFLSDCSKVISGIVVNNVSCTVADILQCIVEVFVLCAALITSFISVQVVQFIKGSLTIGLWNQYAACTKLGKGFSTQISIVAQSCCDGLWLYSVNESLKAKFIYSRTSHNGHLYRVDTSALWTKSFGPDRNRSQMYTNMFCIRTPLSSVQQIRNFVTWHVD